MIGLIGAMEPEVALLREAMTGIRTVTEGIFEFALGKLEGKDAVLLRCGVGKVNAAAGCVVMILKWRPSLIINTGSAGGTGGGLAIGDVIIADGLVYHDVDVTAFNYKPGQLPGGPPVYPVDEKLIALAEAAMDELKKEGALPAGMNHVRGLIGSGDVFMHEESRIAAVTKTFPALRAVEMESAGIAQACSLFGTPSLIIRSLSDIAGKESPLTHDEFLPLASKNSAELVRRIVRAYKENLP